jgi:hypothetical protein
VVIVLVLRDADGPVTMPLVAEALGLERRPGAFTARLTGTVVRIEGEGWIYLDDRRPAGRVPSERPRVGRTRPSQRASAAVHLPVALTGPASSDSADTSQCCRGCSHPPQPLRRPGGEDLSPPLDFARFVARMRLGPVISHKQSQRLSRLRNRRSAALRENNQRPNQAVLTARPRGPGTAASQQHSLSRPTGKGTISLQDSGVQEPRVLTYRRLPTQESAGWPTPRTD